MRRRSFVKSALVSSAAATILPAIGYTAAKKPALYEFYELKVYALKDAEQQKVVEDYLSGAALPAFNRAGIKHVGVFTEMSPQGQTKIYTLTPYQDAGQLNTLAETLSKDAQYLSAGAAFLEATAKDPAYERIESSLLRSFSPTLKIDIAEQKARIFELRQYQNASTAASKKKMEMFTDQGEISIFKRLGFRPVFWAETVIGNLMPNLTYMVSFDDLAAKGSHWKSFGADPEWKKISSVPEYADALLVSKITSTMLVPAAYSQI